MIDPLKLRRISELLYNREKFDHHTGSIMVKTWIESDQNSCSAFIMADHTSNTHVEADTDAGEAGGVVGVARKRVLTFLKRHDQLVGKFLPKLLEAMIPVSPLGLCVCAEGGGGNRAAHVGGSSQVDQKSSKVLLKRLSSSVSEGEAPSFADPGARSGYTRRRMKHRSAQVVKCFLSLLLCWSPGWNPAEEEEVEQRSSLPDAVPWLESC